MLFTLSHNSLGFNRAGGTAPHPRTRDKSFPVPTGSMHTSGIGLIFLRAISLRIQPIVPSPPATNMRHDVVRILVIRFNASFGPDELNSNI